MSTIKKPFINDPIFEYSKVNYVNKSSIVTLKVQNESMFIALSNEKTKQWMIQHVRIQTGKKTDIPLTLAPNDFISKLFLDPTGSHCIVSTNGGENFYFHSKTLKCVNLKKTKGNVITAIGWNIEYGTNTDTSFILVGTSSGSIFETNISSSGTLLYFKMLAESISTNKLSPISDIVLSVVSVAKNHKWVAFICLPGQLHILTTTMNTVEAIQQQTGTFVGTFVEPQNAILSSMFSSKEAIRHRYVNQGPKSCSGFSVNTAEAGVTPTRYCWTNEEGISIGAVDLSKDVESYDLIEEQGFIKHERHNGLMNYPIMVEMSEFHVIVLHRNQVAAYSAYNFKKYFEQAFDDSAPKICGVSRDASSQMVWIFTEQSMWKYKPNNEKRYVWKVFMNGGDFEKARLLTQSMDGKTPFQLVVKRQADCHFNKEAYAEAAKYYCESEEAFDVVVLKFMTSQTPQKRKGLKAYLMLRLGADQDLVRITLLVWWILEISLSELAEIRKGETEESKRNVVEMKKELEAFLQSPNVLRCLKDNKEAAYKLIISHLDFDTHILLSKLLKDYETLIRILLLQNKFSDALEVIKERARPSLFYKFAPEILPAVPIKFLQVILQNDAFLDPSELLPAFYKCVGNPELVAAAFQYFSHVVDNGRGTRPIHAFLIMLYAEYKPTKLLEYLTKYSNAGMGEAAYDAGNALRLCIRKKNLKSCCVFLYQLEGMYESAVKYALEIDLDLAKECAKQVGEEKDDFMDFDDSTISSSEEVQKHVWLTIARHMIKNNFPTADVMKLIKESGNVVNVDDLLPLFPEFTSIEALQGPLCECLKEKSEKIQDLQKSIKEASELAESIKKDIDTRQKTYRLVKISDKCFRCDGNLFQRPFFAFNCWHYLHSDCCEEILLGLFKQDETIKYNFYKAEYEKLSKQYAREEDPIIKRKLDLVKKKLGEMLSDDCPLCGKRVINLIDEPFYTEQEYQEEMEKWKI